MGFRGAIFDVDGVLVDSPHEQAWRDGSAAAHGERVERHPGTRRPTPPRGSRPRSTRGRCRGKPRYDGRPGRAGVLRGARRRGARPGVRRPQAGDDRGADRSRASSTPTPTPCASCSPSRTRACG